MLSVVPKWAYWIKYGVKIIINHVNIWKINTSLLSLNHPNLPLNRWRILYIRKPFRIDEKTEINLNAKTVSSNRKPFSELKTICIGHWSKYPKYKLNWPYAKKWGLKHVLNHAVCNLKLEILHFKFKTASVILRSSGWNGKGSPQSRPTVRVYKSKINKIIQTLFFIQ